MLININGVSKKPRPTGSSDVIVSSHKLRMLFQQIKTSRVASDAHWLRGRESIELAVSRVSWLLQLGKESLKETQGSLDCLVKLTK